MRRTSACAQLATACALPAALLAGVSTQTRADITVLDSGRSIHGRVAPGVEDRYQVVMAAGEFARVVVEQEGTDLLVDVHGVGEGADEEFQDEIRPYGEERVDIVAREAGTYTLTVTPADGAAGAGAYALRLVSRRPVTSADRVLQQSRTLRTAARRLERAGKFDEARPAFERALTLADDLRRPDDTYAGMIAFDLAGNSLELHDDSRARSLYERAIATFDRAWGAEHPYAGMARSRLALLCERAGRHQDAERLAREALTVIERSLGPDHPWLARCLTTLANIRDDAGDLSEAEALDRRALAIVERIHETGTILDATVLNNLALVRRERGDSAEAEALFERSLAIGEKVRGPQSYFVSTALQNLGIMARERKDYATALACYERALSVRERIVGSGHPDVAGLLNNLANVYRATGDIAKALETHFRALRIWERTAGPYGRATLLSVGNIARTYASAGDTAHALVFERRADAILERQLALNLAAGSERQKVAFVRSVAERTDRTISLHLDEAPDDPDAASLAALVLLQRKGRVQEAMTDVFGAVRRRVAEPVDRELMDRLNETNARLARLALNRPDGAGPEGGQPSLADLEARREQLEATLSEHSAEFRAEIRPVTLEAVQAAMPEGAALVEFTVYRPFDPRAERNADAYGPARYAAYVVRKHAPAVGRDLGPVATIDPLIERFRGALRDPATTDVVARARALDERVVRPLSAWLDGATRLLISPDGELNLVPFEALVDEDGRYLIERYPTSYVSSGRDLLRLHPERATPGRPVIVADPLFGEPRRTAPAARRGAAATAAARAPRLYFAPLSGSAAEGRAIKALFPDARLLTGPRATKAGVEAVKAPRILHIASHGFFLSDDEARPAEVRNPLLRSGLALAGANLAQGAGGDGILTALEAADLDLRGTKLVTLSACDTGVGEVRSGEGVYGLRRAFVLAGAEAVVMTLWPVSDSIARDTMVAYYEGLRAGAGRGDALRQAKLAILGNPKRRHPYYWASFIQSGDWTSLDGRP